MALEAAEKVAATDDVVQAVSFATSPERYVHWHLSIDGAVATLAMDVDEQRGLRPGYAMKLNSYDLGVDIELHDAVQRLRFEHPEVGVRDHHVGARTGASAPGANIGMLAQASHPWKVNFCKFTNETRSAIEDASANSGQTYIAAVNGAAAGGGFELALACDEILLIDDGSAAVSLPELPLLGGSARDRRAHAPGRQAARAPGPCRRVRDQERGCQGADRAVAVGTRRRCDRAWAVRRRRSRERAGRSPVAVDRPHATRASCSSRSCASIREGRIDYEHVSAAFDRDARVGHDHRRRSRPTAARGCDGRASARQRVLAAGRRTRARRSHPAPAYQRAHAGNVGHEDGGRHGPRPRARRVPARAPRRTGSSTRWCCSEARVQAPRRHQSQPACFRSSPGAVLAGCCWSSRSHATEQFMLDGARRRTMQPAVIVITESNTGVYPMGNDLSRLESRFFGRAPELDAARAAAGRAARRGSGIGAGPRDLRARRDRLGGRAAHRARGARCASARRAHRRWRRTSASSAPRPWRRRSSAGSPPGRTGSSAAPTRSAPQARSGVTAAVSALAGQGTGVT